MKIAKITYTILLTAFIVFMAVGSGTQPIPDLYFPETIAASSPLTHSEYRELISVYNYEIKQLGGRFKVNKGESVLEALNRNILEREVSMMEVSPFKEKRISYEEYRRNLINKVK